MTLVKLSCLIRTIGMVIAALLPAAVSSQPLLGHRSVPLLKEQGLTFKDLNRNGRLDRYEDWRLPALDRANDLLAQMTVEQKAGLMVHAMAPSQGGVLSAAPFDQAALRQLIQSRHIRYVLSAVSDHPRSMAAMVNEAQAVAENEPLAIPIVFSSDPRNHLSEVSGQSVAAGRFSQWPDPPGLAATGDNGLVRRFGEIAAAEYRAVGLRMTLSPMADLATEPRWARVNGTFGSNPDAVARFVTAYVEGFQGGASGLGPQSVATVLKHWVGYGAEPDGYDAHNYYGRTLAFPGGRFMDHVHPFEAAFKAGPAAVMTTYGMPPAGFTIDGKPVEQVGASFSRQMLTELLRDRYRFNGFVVTDFLIAHDCNDDCRTGTLDLNKTGMPWGVEALSEPQRVAKAINAGVDQIGGSNRSDLIVQLVRDGQITTERLDTSARRLLIQEFELGLFENPYVDPRRADAVVGSPAFVEAGRDAQRRSLVLLKNEHKALPLKSRIKLWLWKTDATVARRQGYEVVATPEAADVAVLRITTPFTTHPNYLFGSLMKEGWTSFAADNADRQAVERAAASGRPTVVIAHLDRAAVLTPIRERVAALLVDFGATDAAVFDVLSGKVSPTARLPYELPSSDEAVAKQLPDTPDDSADPLYPRGFGLSYDGVASSAPTTGRVF